MARPSVSMLSPVACAVSAGVIPVPTSVVGKPPLVAAAVFAGIVLPALSTPVGASAPAGPVLVGMPSPPSSFPLYESIYGGRHVSSSFASFQLIVDY